MTLKIYFELLASIILVSFLNGKTISSVDNSTKFSLQKSDTSKPMTQKKFKEADNTAVFTTKFVITDKKEITEVHHDKDDGAWLFFSDDQFDYFSKVAKLVGLGQITKIDNTLFEIADMPIGHIARRKFKGDKWIIEKKK